jgi:hypothetical protein
MVPESVSDRPIGRHVMVGLDRPLTGRFRTRSAAVGTMRHPGTGIWGALTGIIQRFICSAIVTEYRIGRF